MSQIGVKVGSSDQRSSDEVLVRWKCQNTSNESRARSLARRSMTRLQRGQLTEQRIFLDRQGKQGFNSDWNRHFQLDECRGDRSRRKWVSELETAAQHSGSGPMGNGHHPCLEESGSTVFVSTVPTFTITPSFLDDCRSESAGSGCQALARGNATGKRHDMKSRMLYTDRLPGRLTSDSRTLSGNH